MPANSTLKQVNLAARQIKHPIPLQKGQEHDKVLCQAPYFINSRTTQGRGGAASRRGTPHISTNW